MKTDQTTRTPVICFEKVSKTFRRSGWPEAVCAVDDVSLTIEQGQLVAILGKTGCGKSTLFNMIAGLLKPTEGRVLIAGQDPYVEFDRLRGKMAIVFQNDRLMPWRTAIQNVELGLEIARMPKQERRRIGLHWLFALGLSGHEGEYPHALSGGMRQRVSIARAFATNAEILLCDESFSALDEVTAHRLREQFARLVHEHGKTAVFITHSISEALQIGDRIVVLRKPAKIALDLALDATAGEDERRLIRSQIQGTLAE